MRYQAPKHTSGVFTPSGELRADEKGVIEVADDASDDDHAALRRAGCTVIADKPAATPETAAKAKSPAPAPEQPE